MFERLRRFIPAMDTQPGVAVRACSLIQAWLDAGCDARLDILPAIDRAWVRVPGKVSSPQYFDGPVRKALEDRTKPEIEKNAKAEFRLNALRWKRDRGLYLNDRELAEVARHDAAHQPTA